MLKQLVTSVKAMIAIKLIALTVMISLEPIVLAFFPMLVFLMFMNWYYIGRQGCTTWYRILQAAHFIMFTVLVFLAFDAFIATVDTVGFFLVFMLPINILGCSDIWQHKPESNFYTTAVVKKASEYDEPKIYEAEIVDD